MDNQPLFYPNPESAPPQQAQGAPRWISGNRYLDMSFQGRPHWAWYLLTGLVGILGWQVLGALPIVGVLAFTLLDNPDALSRFLQHPSDFSLIPYPIEVIFSALMLAFVCGILALWIFFKLIQGRSFTTLLTGFPKVRWGRYLLVSLVTFLLLGISSLLMALVSPDSFQPTIGMGNWLRFLPFALILLPFQTAFEEMLFRGVMLQGLHRIMPRFPWLSIVVSSVLFGLMHSFNPEVGHFGFLQAMASYMSMGMLLGVLAVVDEGLELPSALHFANNLFSFTMVGYTGMVLPTPCLFILKEPNPLLDIISTPVLGALLVLIFCRRKGRQWRILFKGAQMESVASAPLT